MPRAIILYEIDPSFGPNIIAEYYLKQDDKIPQAVLKEFSEKHSKKELVNITVSWENDRFYSSRINAESIDKDNLYISSILQEGENLVSLKSFVENLKDKILQNFSSDKKQMKDFLQNALNSILSLIQRLKEPKVIKETINDRTKKMLDDGKLTEARELIDLGEEIPIKLADEVKLAEQFLEDEFYRKSKKSFLKAAELATLIQEDEIASFLEKKGEQVGLFPDLLKEKENLNKEILKISNDLDSVKLNTYNRFIEPIEKLVEISHLFEEHEYINDITKLKSNAQRASRLAKELDELDEKIRELIKKI